MYYLILGRILGIIRGRGKLPLWSKTNAAKQTKYLQEKHRNGDI